MEEIRLYDIDSMEFSELIDTTRVELKRNNLEYQKFKNQVNKIMESKRQIRFYNKLCS